MDALAQGYGSDSSSEDDSSQPAARPPAKPSTLGLLANYSDDSDVDDASDKEQTKARGQTPTTSIGHDKLSPQIEAAIDPPAKKQRLSNEIDNEEEQQGGLLPPPQLLQSTTKHSINAPILFRKNYLEHKRKYTTTNQNHELCEKLNQLRQNQTSGLGSFAQQLKSQKEFGNPHMFTSIIKHFGIDPMETNIDAGGGGGKKSGFEAFEFVERLLVKEEENRVRQAQG